MPPPQRRPRLTYGELESVDDGGEEVVAADHGSDSASDKDKQRKVAATIEHPLTVDPQCCMCEVCVLKCKIQRRHKRRKGRVDMGEAPTKFGAQCLASESDVLRGCEFCALRPGS